MKKKKILIVINSLGIGGAEKSLVSLLSMLDYNKIDVFVQLFRYGGIFEELLPQSVNVLSELDYISFSQKSLPSQILMNKPQYLYARIKTSILLKKNKKAMNGLHDAQVYWKGTQNVFVKNTDHFDIAIAWGQGNPTHYVATKVVADKKIAWVNADYEAVGHNKQFDFEYYGLYDQIVCVSEQLTDKFKLIFPEYSTKIQTILDIQSYDLNLRMADEECNLQDTSKWKLTSIGRLTNSKNFSMAIEAANILKKRGIKFIWYIVGDGPERDLLNELLEEYQLNQCVFFTGARSNPYPYIKWADIYVQTSLHEGYCLTLAEARMLNCPCVTTNFDVVNAQMIDKENGLIVDMDPKDVADAIQLLMEDKLLYNHIYEYLQNEKKGNIEEFSKFCDLIEI